jgi:hypothetical protein
MNYANNFLARGFSLVVLLFVTFAAILLSPGVASEASVRILDSHGNRMSSIFERLRPSPQAFARPYLSAASRPSCTPATVVATKRETDVASPAAFRTVSTKRQRQGRYTTVQSNCGGHYADCFEDFCTIDCDYLFCGVGGGPWQSGYKTQYWNGCCYSDEQCLNP